MTKQTYDVCYRLQLPCHFHIDVKADTVEDAIAIAKSRFDDEWSGGRSDAHVEFVDYDSAEIAYIDDAEGEPVAENITLFSDGDVNKWSQLIDRLARLTKDGDMIDVGDGPQAWFPDNPDTDEIEVLWHFINQARALTSARPTGFVDPSTNAQQET